MNCPVCNSSKLIPRNLELNLSSLRCLDCGGNWIQGKSYWRWLEEHGCNLPERPAQEETMSLAESTKFLDCPECRFRLAKYHVGRGLDFKLDHCEGCKGIWLDRNEWEVLKKRNLHDDLNSMLTGFWQARAQKEERKKNMVQIYITRFGSEDYAEIKQIREWLDGHSKKHDLLAYLTDKDPFDI